MGFVCFNVHLHTWRAANVVWRFADRAPSPPHVLFAPPFPQDTCDDTTLKNEIGMTKLDIRRLRAFLSRLAAVKKSAQAAPPGKLADMTPEQRAAAKVGEGVGGRGRGWACAEEVCVGGGPGGGGRVTRRSPNLPGWWPIAPAAPVCVFKKKIVQLFSRSGRLGRRSTDPPPRACLLRFVQAAAAGSSMDDGSTAL